MNVNGFCERPSAFCPLLSAFLYAVTVDRFITWDALNLRVNGERVEEMARELVIRPGGELQSISLRFMNGLLRVEGIVRKFIAIPFSVDVPEIACSGTTVRVPLRSPAAFGFIPLPQILFRLMEARLPRDLVRLEEGAVLVIALDRFLPSFLSVTIQSIWIVDGGLAVTLGRGGADLPPDGGINGPI